MVEAEVEHQRQPQRQKQNIYKSAAITGIHDGAAQT
jgi:hypothetical protein